MVRSALDFIRMWLVKWKILTLENEVYYINGSDVLPPPYTAEEEAEVVRRLEESEGQEQMIIRNALIEHNLRLVVYIAKRFENTGVGMEDLISIGTIGLMKAVSSFKSEKNIKLATYASKCIENEILMFIRKTSNLKMEVSIEEPLNVDWDGNELLLGDILGSEPDEVNRHLEIEEERVSIRKAVSGLNERDRLIITLRFGLHGKDEMTQKEVADTLGISQSYISRLEKRIIDKLKKEISSS
ncbi:MAG TPA: RNA polymerase sporulation sigma factor SigE [Clostridiales bacterium]|nr:RNA polymerase sporulation sigma factor SigE [Clostridiales bacterium]